jgi:mRNA deadenylase 3'-5' endonuclease subunit Ccr4
LFNHLKELNADIYCLQEVTEKGLRETFIPKFKSMNIRCVGYAPSKKFRDVEVARHSHKHIGTAIFCAADRFQVVASNRIWFKDFLPRALNGKGNENQIPRNSTFLYLNRSQENFNITNSNNNNNNDIDVAAIITAIETQEKNDNEATTVTTNASTTISSSKSSKSVSHNWKLPAPASSSSPSEQSTTTTNNNRIQRPIDTPLPFINELCRKNNMMIAVQLYCQQTQRSFVVGNAHFYWDPKRQDIKAAQSYAAMKALQTFVRTTQQRAQPRRSSSSSATLGGDPVTIGSIDEQAQVLIRKQQKKRSKNLSSPILLHNNEEEEDGEEEEEEEENEEAEESEFQSTEEEEDEEDKDAIISSTTATTTTSTMAKYPPIIFCGDMNIMPYLSQDTIKSENNGLSEEEEDEYEYEDDEDSTDDYEEVKDRQKLIEEEIKSVPSYNLSGPFHLLTYGQLPVDHPHHPNQWPILHPKFKLPKPYLKQFNQPFMLSNVYHISPFERYQPWFTTKTDTFQGWIDHIWCNLNHWEVEMVLKVPLTQQEKQQKQDRQQQQRVKYQSESSSSLDMMDTMEIDEDENDVENPSSNDFPPIPTDEFPSDHVPIGVVLRFK